MACITVTNRLTGYSYDAAGNLTSDGLHSYTYNPENRISQVDGAWTYTYDGDGKRVKRANGSTGTLYWTGIGSDAVSESDLASNVAEQYVYFNGQRVARVDRPSGTVHYYFSDHWGLPEWLPTLAAIFSSNWTYRRYFERTSWDRVRREPTSVSSVRHFQLPAGPREQLHDRHKSARR
ncbi:MAG: hypothetical protein ACM34E_12450 [Acidobacteriota bacterium]